MGENIESPLAINWLSRSYKILQLAKQKNKTKGNYFITQFPFYRIGALASIF